MLADAHPGKRRPGCYKAARIAFTDGNAIGQQPALADEPSVEFIRCRQRGRMFGHALPGSTSPSSSPPV